jgi:hypothetical protein
MPDVVQLGWLHDKASGCRYAASNVTLAVPDEGLSDQGMAQRFLPFDQTVLYSAGFF